MQVSWPETSLKRDSGTGILLWIFCNFLKETLFTEHHWMTAPTDSSVQTEGYPLITLCSFLHFFHYLIDNCNYRSLLRKCLKMKIFLLFTNIYSKINMLLRQFHLSNNLPTHIQENIDFPQQKSQQLQSTEVNFKDWGLSNI